MIQRQHCHPTLIVERAVRYFGIILLAVLVNLIQAVSEASELWIPGAAAAACALLILALCWLSWSKTYISLTETTLTYESGIITKKRVEIPFSKINTIDMGRNLFERIVGTCRLKIDTGAMSADADESSETDLVFSLADAERLRSFILSRSAADEDELRREGKSPLEQREPSWAIRAGMGDFFLYGLTSSSVWRLFWLGLLGLSFIGELSSGVIEKAAQSVFPVLMQVWETATAHGIIVLILLILACAAAVALAANIISVLWAAVRFYNFRVAREGDNIIVRYGLISLKHYTLPVRNIHAVVVRRNTMQQLLGRCSAEVVSVGYGDEQNETALLFPIIKTDRLAWLIDTLLPEYSGSPELHRASRRAVRYMIVWPLIFYTLFSAAAIFACSFIMDSIIAVSAALAAGFVVLLVTRLLAYRHCAMGWNDKSLVMQSGGLHMQTHHIRMDAVQSVRSSGGFFKRRRGVRKYTAIIHAPVLRQTVVCKWLDHGYLREICEVIEK